MSVTQKTNIHEKLNIERSYIYFVNTNKLQNK
jgi:hypothetical protein